MIVDTDAKVLCVRISSPIMGWFGWEERKTAALVSLQSVQRSNTDSMKVLLPLVKNLDQKTE